MGGGFFAGQAKFVERATDGEKGDQIWIRGFCLNRMQRKLKAGDHKSDRKQYASPTFISDTHHGLGILQIRH